MTAIDIMSQARERLGDVTKTRWSDARLLSIVSQGQIDICVESHYLRKEVILPLIVHNTRYTLPKDCIAIKRVEFDGKLLPIHTRSDKDNKKEISETEYIAYKSNLQVDKLEIQPAPTKLQVEILYAKGESTEDTLFVGNPYGVVVSSTDPEMSVNPLYGCVTSFSSVLENNEPSDKYGAVAGSSFDTASADFLNGIYGVVTQASYVVVDDKFGGITAVDGHIVSGRFGIVTDVASLSDTFHVYYVAYPNKLASSSAILVIPELWEELLLRYTVGTALQDDNDANNIARGEAELQKYSVKLESIKKLSFSDFSSSASDKNETFFRSI